MRSRWTIFWIFVLLIGAVLFAWGLLRGSKMEPGATLPPPDNVRQITFVDAEIAEMQEAFTSGQEPWRSSPVEVVKHELTRLGFAPGASVEGTVTLEATPTGSPVEVREHGEYPRQPDGTHRTLIFVLEPGVDIGGQQTVLLAENKSGIWIPKEVGPFYVMVDRLGQ